MDDARSYLQITRSTCHRPLAAEVPGFAKDGGKNVKMKDGKEKNVMPVSTAEYNPCGWRVLVE